MTDRLLAERFPQTKFFAPVELPPPAPPPPAQLSPAGRALLLAVAGGAELHRGGTTDVLVLDAGIGCQVRVTAETSDRLAGLGLLQWERGNGDVWAKLTGEGERHAMRELEAADAPG